MCRQQSTLCSAWSYFFIGLEGAVPTEFWWALLPGKILKEEKWEKTTTASMATDLKVSAKAHYLLPPVHSRVTLPDLVSCLVGWPGLILPGHALCSPCCSLTVLSCPFAITVSQHRIKRHLSGSAGCQLHSSRSWELCIPLMAKVRSPVKMVILFFLFWFQDTEDGNVQAIVISSNSVGLLLYHSRSVSHFGTRTSNLAQCGFKGGRPYYSSRSLN